MDLKTTKDAILVRNCILARVKFLKWQFFNDTKGKISSSDYDRISKEYINLQNALNSSDISQAKILLYSGKTDEFKSFFESFRSASAKDFAEMHLSEILQVLKENGTYSEKKATSLRQAFYKGNEDLLDVKTTDMNELEEEPELHTSTNKLPPSLVAIKRMLKTISASKTIGADVFKNFCTDYSSNVLVFAKGKFQESFSANGQTLTDLSISYSYDDNFNRIYSAVFSLDQNGSESTQTYQKPASFINSYFQSVCHAYLESQKYSQKSVAALRTLSDEDIHDLVDDFSRDYKNLAEMSKCKINITSNQGKIENMFFSIITEHTPEHTINLTDSPSPVSQGEIEPEI